MLLAGHGGDHQLELSPADATHLVNIGSGQTTDIVRFGVYGAERQLIWDSGEIIVEQGSNTIPLKGRPEIPVGGFIMQMRNGQLVAPV